MIAKCSLPECAVVQSLERNLKNKQQIFCLRKNATINHIIAFENEIISRDRIHIYVQRKENNNTFRAIILHMGTHSFTIKYKNGNHNANKKHK